LNFFLTIKGKDLIEKGSSQYAINICKYAIAQFINELKHEKQKLLVQL